MWQAVNAMPVGSWGLFIVPSPREGRGGPSATGNTLRVCVRHGRNNGANLGAVVGVRLPSCCGQLSLFRAAPLLMEQGARTLGGVLYVFLGPEPAVRTIRSKEAPGSIGLDRLTRAGDSFHVSWRPGKSAPRVHVPATRRYLDCAVLR